MQKDFDQWNKEKKVINSQPFTGFIHEGIQFAVILSQVRLLSTNRFTRRIRRIDQKLFAQIKEALIERAI